MDTKDWLQILVGVVILGTLAWVSTQIFDIKGTLSKVDERVVAIADEMPEIGRYAAWREVDAPIKGALLASLPFKGSDKKWKVTVHILNPNSNETIKYLIPLSDQNDKAVACSLIGNAVLYEREGHSFDRMVYFSRKAGEKVNIPGEIDTKISFIFKEKDPKKLAQMISLIGGHPEYIKYGSTSKKWTELVEEFESPKMASLKLGAE